MANGRKDGNPDGHAITVGGKLNATSKILSDVHIDGPEGGAIAVQVVASGAPGMSEVAGGTQVLNNETVVFNMKRWLAFAWQDTATGSVVIDGITYTPGGLLGLPIYPLLPGGSHHRDITAVFTVGTLLIATFLDA